MAAAPGTASRVRRRNRGAGRRRASLVSRAHHLRQASAVTSAPVVAAVLAVLCAVLLDGQTFRDEPVIRAGLLLAMVVLVVLALVGA